MELGPGVLAEPATVDALRATVVRWGTTRAAPSVRDTPPDPGLGRPSIAC
jgi:hypothetical protein